MHSLYGTNLIKASKLYNTKQLEYLFNLTNLSQSPLPGWIFEVRLYFLFFPESYVNIAKEENCCQLCRMKFTPETCDQTSDTLCSKCFTSVDSAPQILASRSEENWRGLTLKHYNKVEKMRTKSGKKARYLDKNQVTYDALSHEKLKGVPVLKNGNDRRLQVIKITALH